MNVRSFVWVLGIFMFTGCGQAVVTHSPPTDAPDLAPAPVHDGPVRMTIYLRDASALVIGWQITSGPEVEARGVVSEPPTSRCILVSGDWTLSAWRVQDVIDRPDALALAGPMLSSGEVPADGDVTLAIDVDWSGNPSVEVDRIPEWWRGAEPECP